MFERLMLAIDDEIVHRIYKVQVQQAPQAVNRAESIELSKREPQLSSNNQALTTKKKLGRTIPVLAGK